MEEELKNYEVIQKNLTALQQILTAAALLNEVNNAGTAFTDDLLPGCTEEFLEQLSGKLNALGLFLETLNSEDSEINKASQGIQ
jgi:hypothetical protein